jgi:hypothetical protein
MSDDLERETVIELLDKLGSEQDADVLEAARALHQQISDAGMQWEDLLVSDEAAAPTDDSDVERDEEDEDEEEQDQDSAPEPIEIFAGDETETPALIDKLLARSDNSEAFREELQEYKSDLAKGEFEPSDHRYIQALYTRLSKTK